MIELPDKLSDLMEVALTDLALVEADPNYEVNMLIWHQPSKRNAGTPQEKYVCSVCFAGALMAKTFGASPSEVMVDVEFGKQNLYKFQALDYVRRGWVREALYRLGLFTNDYMRTTEALVLEGCVCRVYVRDPAAWRKDMWAILEQLRKVGL